MTTAEIVTVSIEGNEDIANVRNVARQSAQSLSFSVTEQARVGWAVANLARLMLTLGHRDAMKISQIHQGDRRGIQITCNGKWLRLVRASWLEQKTLSDISQWADEVEFVEGSNPYLMMVIWAPENGIARS